MSLLFPEEEPVWPSSDVLPGLLDGICDKLFELGFILLVEVDDLGLLDVERSGSA